MPRRNHVKRRGQRRRISDESGMPRALRPSAPTPLPLSQMVLPAGRCYYKSKYGKLIFKTEDDAKTALKHAQTKRKRYQSNNGHVETRYYPCPEGGCGGFHLTSRERFEERGKA